MLTELRNTYNEATKAIYKLEDYIEEHKNETDFETQNTIKIKERQLKAVVDLRKAVDTALWELYDEDVYQE